MAFWNRNRRKRYIIVAKDNWHYDYTLEALTRHFNYSYDDLLRTIFYTGITELEKRMQEERTTFPTSEPSVVLRSSTPPPLPPRNNDIRLVQRGKVEAKASIYKNGNLTSTLAFHAGFARYLLNNGWCWCTLQNEGGNAYLVFSRIKLHGSYLIRPQKSRACVHNSILIDNIFRALSIRKPPFTTHLNLGRNISLNKDALRFRIELESND